NRFAFVGLYFVAQLLELFLGLIRERVGVVLDLDCFLRLLVFVGVRFRFAAHLLDFVLTQTARTGDGDFLLRPGAEIFGRHMQDAVGVDVEGHFDLRYAARGWRNSIEMERAEIFIVARKRALALQHFDFHTRLVVAVSRKDLRFPCWDGGVARNHRRGHATCRFDRERQRRYVEQEHVFDVATEHTALNGRPNRDDFVRIDAFVRFLANQ